MENKGYGKQFAFRSSASSLLSQAMNSSGNNDNAGDASNAAEPPAPTAAVAAEPREHPTAGAPSGDTSTQNTSLERQNEHLLDSEDGDGMSVDTDAEVFESESEQGNKQAAGVAPNSTKTSAATVGTKPTQTGAAGQSFAAASGSLQHATQNRGTNSGRQPGRWRGQRWQRSQRTGRRRSHGTGPVNNQQVPANNRQVQQSRGRGRGA